jgi:hypothetical protein
MNKDCPICNKRISEYEIPGNGQYGMLDGTETWCTCKNYNKNCLACAKDCKSDEEFYVCSNFEENRVSNEKAEAVINLVKTVWSQSETTKEG